MTPAYAHGDAQASDRIWAAWTLDPYVLVLLAAAAMLYWRGSLRVGRRGVCFAGGMAMLFFALVWPLDVIGERLFCAHMAQHLVLMNLAAPLLVLGAPLGPFLRALPPSWRPALVRAGAAASWRATWRWLTGLMVATLAQQLVLWAWHTPDAIAAALVNDEVHVVMHASLLVAALVFWTAVLRPRNGTYWGSLAALLFTLKLSGLVSIVLLLHPGSLYPAYGNSAAAWGLSAEQDEQVGWGLMMIVGTLTYLAAACALFLGSMSEAGYQDA